MIDTEQSDLFGDISLRPSEKFFTTSDEELAVSEDL